MKFVVSLHMTVLTVKKCNCIFERKKYLLLTKFTENIIPVLQKKIISNFHKDIFLFTKFGTCGVINKP